MRRRLTQPECDRLRRLCQVHTMTDAGAILGVSRDHVAAVRDRGWRAAQMPRRARPGDFALNARTMKIQELMVHYRAGNEAVRRWAAEIGRAPLSPSANKTSQPIPEDLAERVAELGPYGAAAHYGVSYGTVRRWRKQRGLAFSCSRQPGARRGITPRKNLVGWADDYGRRAATGASHGR